MMPSENINALPMMSCNKITVVKPDVAAPLSFIQSVCTPSTSEATNKIKPNPEITCSGTEENEVSARNESRSSVGVDHLDSLPDRSATVNGSCTRRKPSQADIPR